MRRRDAVENETQILAAFDRLQKRNPTSAPSMSDVVRESELGRATVYRHFPDIGSLVFRRLDRAYVALFQRWREEFSLGGDAADPAARIRDFVSEMRSLANENRALILDDKCQVSSAYRRAQQSFREILLLAISAGEEPSSRLKAIADLIARHGEAEHLAFVLPSVSDEDGAAHLEIVSALVALARRHPV